MRPMERFRSAVAEDMLSAAASISLSALSPCWLAILSILAATANWSLPNVPAALRFTAAETESIVDIRLPARLPSYPTSERYDTGRLAVLGSGTIQRISIGRTVLDSIALRTQSQFRTHTEHRTVGFLRDRCRQHHMLRFRRRHCQDMCGLARIGNGRVLIFGLTFGLC